MARGEGTVDPALRPRPGSLSPQSSGRPGPPRWTPQSGLETLTDRLTSLSDGPRARLPVRYTGFGGDTASAVGGILANPLCSRAHSRTADTVRATTGRR